MKKLNVLAVSVAIAAGSLSAGTAVAGASANVGYTSDYYFRGIYQASSSASAGLDYEHDSGLYVGTWWGDVGSGLETDYYAGFAGEASGFSYDIAYIVYDYTDEFDDKYTEIDLNFGYGPISIEYAMGEYDTSPATLDYTFAAITAEHNGFYVKFASFGDDFDGSYTELGYGAEVSGFDMGVSLLSNDEDLDVVTAKADGETTLIFTLGKSFDL
ncbi:MAG TPA: TorF family putative porin [Gammaproteobacteria bacterium]